MDSFRPLLFYFITMTVTPFLKLSFIIIHPIFSKKENSRQINNLWYLFRCVTGMSYQHCRIIAKEFVPILKLVKHVCCKVKGSSWPLHLQGDGFIKWNAPGVWKTQHASRKQVWICNPPPHKSVDLNEKHKFE